MKDLSQAAKLRISKSPKKRSEHMTRLIKLRHSRLTTEEKREIAMKMVRARQEKRLARIAK